MRGVGWQRISIRSDECSRISKEFLDAEREALGPLIFSQEYECQFHDDETNAFSAELIRQALDDSFEPFLKGVVV